MGIGEILQPTHLLFILVVALIFLGPKRLPEAGRALGRGIRDFRMAIGGEDQNQGAIPTDTMTAPAPPISAAPVSPAPEPLEAQPSMTAAPFSPAAEPAEAPPPPPPSGPPPPSASSPAQAESAVSASRVGVPEPADPVETADAAESAEPARPFV